MGNGEATEGTMPEKLLPVHIVARRLSCSRDTVYRFIHAGCLKAQNIRTRQKNYWRVYESSVTDFLSKRENV